MILVDINLCTVKIRDISLSRIEAFGTQQLNSGLYRKIRDGWQPYQSLQLLRFASSKLYHSQPAVK